MVTARALNFSSLLQRDLFFRLPSKRNVIDNVSLDGAVKSTVFPVLQAVTVNRKQRFAVMCMSSYSNDVGQSCAACGGISNGNDRSGGDEDDDDLGPILNFEEVMKEAVAGGVCLPLDLLKAAKSTGIPKLCIQRYLHLQGLGWGLGFATQSSSLIRNQMMIDPDYLIEHGYELAFDVFLDVVGASVMKMMGKGSNEIALFLTFLVILKVVTKGIIAPLNYAHRIKLQKKSISQPQGLKDNRIFVAERSKSRIWAGYCCAAAYSSATLFFTGLIILFYG